MIQLIVQGQELDLFKDEVFAISKAVSKVGQFDLRFGDVSIGFNVPLTAKNNAIFRYISNLNNDNLGAFKRFEGQIKEDDAILSSGFYQVLNTNNNKKQIKIRFFGGNSDWFDLIKDRFINVEYEKQIGNPNSTTYSLRDLDSEFAESTIIASKDNTDGYFYFLADTGLDSNRTNNIFTDKDFQLGVFEHTIFKRIFDSVGIKVQGSIFSDPLFYQTIITAATDLSEFADGTNNSKRYNVTLNPSQYVSGANQSFEPISFNINDTDTQWNGTKYTALGAADNFTFSGRIVTNRSATFWNVGNAQIDINFKKNGLIVGSTSITPDGGLSTDLSLTFDEFDYSYGIIAANDELEVEYRATLPDTNFSPLVVKNGRYLYLESALSYSLEGAVLPFDINTAVPKIKQSDFVKDIMFRLGVISTYNSKKRILSFDKFQNVENNKIQSLDYTDKIDVSKDIEIDFNKIVENYFKTSFIRYKEDENDTQLRLFKTVAKNGLGDGQINIDNDNLTDEGDIFVSQYAATKDTLTMPLTGSSFNFYLPYIPVYLGDSSQDVQPRILIANQNTPINAISDSFSDIEFSGGGTYSNVGYAFFAKQITSEYGITNNVLDTNDFTLSFENFTQAGQTYFGTTLLEKNYDLYRKILNNPIYVPIYLNLTNLDVQNYNPLIPIWLDFSLDSGYYYFEEISQYKSDGSTTKCNLIKI